MQRGNCKHGILFPSIQHLAWLPQRRPQGNKNVVKNSKNINLRRYFKFNREANCNTSIQTFICSMCIATLCNLYYIVVCCELLVYVFWQKVLQYLNNFTKQRAQFVSNSWASCWKQGAQLSQRPRVASCHWILLSHSFEMTLLSRAYVSPYYM